MPLPDTDTPWPPLPRHRIDRWREYDAWYGGDPQRLANVLSAAQYGSYGQGLPPSLRNHAAQYRGGLVGTLARWWWGQPIPAGEQRAKIHVPLPADIATASADLLFAQPPTITCETTTDTDRWQQLDDRMSLRTRLHEAAELCAPAGGVYLRVGWDEQVAGHPLITATSADHAVPTFRWDRLQAVTLWETLEQEGTTVWRYLQRHEMLRDETGKPTTAVEYHGLYEGTTETLGQRRPLDAHDHTRGLEDADARGLPMLPVVYVPNNLPSRVDRAARGRSDFESVTPLFDGLDETFGSWMRDLRLAKARILVPSAYLTSLGPGRGAEFELDREVYEALSIPPAQTGQSITLQQFAIRVEEHDRTMMRIVRQAIGTAGYSGATFGLQDQDGGGEQTATEVIDRRNRSLLTRAKKTGYWGEALQQLAAVVLAVDRIVFGNTQVTVGGLLPTVTWPPGETVDQLRLAQTVAAWETARAASIETKVRALNPQWSEPEIRAEVRRIRAEDGADTADPVEVTRRAAQGLPPEEDPADDGEGEADEG